MQIDITFKNIEPSEALKAYAQKKLAKIAKFFDRPAEAHVILSVQKIRHKAEVTLNADGVIFNAIVTSEDLYAAIDVVMDKLETQIKKHKEKLQTRKPGTKASAEEPVQTAEAKPKKKAKIIREKGYFIKPMSIDEAILQLEVAEDNFILFQNTASKQINLIYKRKDGALCIIEPPE